MNDMLSVPALPALDNKPARIDPLSELLHELDTPLGVALTAASIQDMRLEALAARSFTGTGADSETTRSLADLRESMRLLRRGLDQAITLLAARKAGRAASRAGLADRLDLGVVLGDALTVPMVRFGDRIVECALEVDDALMVRTEPNAWYQLISNLVANSVLHGFVGQEHGGRITISAQRLDAERLRVIYRDDGRGFSDHARANAFVRPYSSRLGAGSSGLGLSIMRDIVQDRLHGTIALLDGAGGAAFAIDTPIDPVCPPR